MSSFGDLLDEETLIDINKIKDKERTNIKKCAGLMKLMSIYKTSNGIYHKNSIFYSSKLSIFGSMIFILLVAMVIISKVKSLGTLSGIDTYSMSLH